MDVQVTVESEALIREIARYLETVDVFRAERCEPTWLPEAQPVSARTWEQQDADAGVATR